jgi:hypothetical protein
MTAIGTKRNRMSFANATDAPIGKMIAIAALLQEGSKGTTC